MYDLPWETHRFYVEPLSGNAHISRILAKRFLSFTEKVKASKKLAIQQLFLAIKSDTRLTTGWNLRFIMIKSGNNRIEDLDVRNTDFEYHLVKDSEKWKIGFVKELIDVKLGDLVVEGFSYEEIDETLRYLCIR